MSATPVTIGYILRSYPVLYTATVFNEIRQLQRKGHTVKVFSLLEVDPRELRRDSIADLPKAIYCWQDRLPAAEVLKANLAIISTIGLAKYRAAYALAKDALLLTNLKSFMRFAAWAYHFKQAGVTHFHGHWATEATTVAMLFAWLTDQPFSFTAHAYDIFFQPQYLAQKLTEASFAVTVSAYNKQFMVEKYGGQFESKLNVIYPLIDLDQFQARPAPPPAGTLNIISVGRLTEYKGLPYLVEACRILKERGVEFLCQIVGGEAEDKPILEDQIEKYGLHDSVKLLGALPHQQIPPLLEKATLFALPCIIAENGDRDGMPLVLIEAMAREVPVVSSEIIGLPELVRPEVGLLVQPKDAEALADAFIKMVDAGPAAQQAMGRAGRRIVEQELDAVIGATQLEKLFLETHKLPAGRLVVQRPEQFEKLPINQ